ncbi:MAG: hypothetical protein M1826_001467 [Phylliscum demangeonii]|nr:MAG: hypothetical protein M1826_001467 [Phylliscum demangeonii]
MSCGLAGTPRAADPHFFQNLVDRALDAVSDMALLAAIHAYGDKQKERLGVTSLMLYDRPLMHLNPGFTVGKAKLTCSAYRGGGATRFFLSQARLYEVEKWTKSFGGSLAERNLDWRSVDVPLGKKDGDGRHWYAALEPIPRDKSCPWCMAHHPDGDCPLSARVDEWSPDTVAKALIPVKGDTTPDQIRQALIDEIVADLKEQIGIPAGPVAKALIPVKGDTTPDQIRQALIDGIIADLKE